jgi:hypothetical protein
VRKSSVLEDREEHARGLRLPRHRRRVRRRRRERLVHDHRQSRRDGAARERHVRDVRRGDDDEVHLARRGEEFVGVAQHPHPGVRRARRTRPARVAGHDGGDPQPRRRRHEGPVEDRAGQAVPDDGDAQRVRRRTHAAGR